MRNILFMQPEKLQENPWNTNQVDQCNMDKLRKSIQTFGFNSAILVRELPNDVFEIIGGAHRVRVAKEIGIKEVPVLSIGIVSDTDAKKIGLADNSRYGQDDVFELATLLKDLDVAELCDILPMDEFDFKKIMAMDEIDLDVLDASIGQEFSVKEECTESTPTYEILKFKFKPKDAEKIKTHIEKIIKDKKINGRDELLIAGDAILHSLILR